MDSTGRDRVGLVPVLAWYRQRLTSTRWGNQRQVVVPASNAGWVLAAAGEPAESDGTRPLGAVRRALLDAIEAAGLGDDDARRQALCAVWGLTEWPDHRVGRPAVWRVTTQRRRYDRDGRLRELSRERVGQLAKSALSILNDAEPERPGGQACSAGPVAEPTTAPWFAMAVADFSQKHVGAIVAEGLDWARLFISRTGTTGPAAAILDDLERYAFHRLRSSTSEVSGRPVVRSHIRALLGIGMWEVLRTGRHRSHGLLPTIEAPVADFGIARPPRRLTVVAPVVAQMMGGDRDGAVLSQCCDEVLRLADVDRASAVAVADLLLGCYGKVGPGTAARILEVAVKLRADSEDWTAVALAEICQRDHPLSYRAVSAMQYAVKVASGHARWSVARRLLDLISSSLQAGIAVPANRDPEGETIEYVLWTIHQQTGTARRLFQEIGGGIAIRAIRGAIGRSQRALACLDRALALNDSTATGDATEQWRHPLLVRQAELAIVLADQGGRSDQAVWLRRADSVLDRARVLCGSFPELDATSAAMVKAELSLAISVGDEQQAVELITALHEHYRWPVHRMVPEIVDIASGRPNSRIGSLLRERTCELVALERAPSWTPAVDPTYRRRRAAYR